MIGAGWTALFGVLQALDPVYDAVTQADGSIVQYPVWPIGADESRKLGDATAGQLATLPAARRKSIAKFLNEYAPGIILAGALYEVAGPRVRFSAAAKKAQRDRTLAAAAAARNGYTGPGHAGNGAARAPAGPADAVSPTRQRADPSGTAAAANAATNGAARAWDAPSDVG